jgi:hypothetical protein
MLPATVLEFGSASAAGQDGGKRIRTNLLLMQISEFSAKSTQLQDACSLLQAACSCHVLFVSETVTSVGSVLLSVPRCT